MLEIKRPDYDPAYNVNFLKTAEKIDIRKQEPFNLKTNWYLDLRPGFEEEAPDYRIYDFPSRLDRSILFKTKKYKLKQRAKLIKLALKKELILPVLDDEGKTIDIEEGNPLTRPYTFEEILKGSFMLKSYAIQYLNSLEESEFAKSPEYNIMMEMLTDTKQAKENISLLSSIKSSSEVTQDPNKRNISIDFSSYAKPETTPVLVKKPDYDKTSIYFDEYIRPIIDFNKFISGSTSADSKLNLDIYELIIQDKNLLNLKLRLIKEKAKAKLTLRSFLRVNGKGFVDKSLTLLWNKISEYDTHPKKDNFVKGNEPFYYEPGMILKGRNIFFYQFFSKILIDYFFNMGDICIPLITNINKFSDFFEVTIKGYLKHKDGKYAFFKSDDEINEYTSGLKEALIYVLTQGLDAPYRPEPKPDDYDDDDAGDEDDEKKKP